MRAKEDGKKRNRKTTKETANSVVATTVCIAESIRVDIIALTTTVLKVQPITAMAL